jgi:flagellar motor switch/type III secretory pathway protein FliN
VSQTVREWLPLQALAGERVRRKLNELVNQWCSRWFAKRAITITDLTALQSSPTAPRGGGTWRRLTPEIAVHCSNVGVSRLLEWSLDASIDQIERTETDQHLLDGFLDAMLIDLAKTLAGHLSGGESGSSPLATVADPLAAQGGVLVGLAHGEGVGVATIAIGRELLLPMVKSLLPARPTAGEPLAPLKSALAATPVIVEVGLGCADLAFSDLSTLAPGDVVLLDRALSDSVDLCLANTDQPFGRASLADRDGGFVLSLQA